MEDAQFFGGLGTETSRTTHHATKHPAFVVAVVLSALVPLLGAAWFQDFASLVAQGKTLLDKGRYAAAEHVFRRAVELRPEDASAHYYLGVALLSEGKNEAAAHSLEKASFLSERSNAAVLFELGNAYLRMSRLDDAESTYRRAIELAPDRAPLHLQLGWVYYRKVEGEKARAEFEKANALEPSALSYYYLALAHHGLGEIRKAAATCRRAIELNPDMADAYVVLGKCQVALGQFDDAEASFARALELKPQAVEAHFQLGLMSLRAGDLTNAARRFEVSVEADPKHASAWYNLALVYTRLGRREAAEKARSRYEELARNAQRLKPRPVKRPKQDHDIRR